MKTKSVRVVMVTGVTHIMTLPVNDAESLLRSLERGYWGQMQTDAHEWVYVNPSAVSHVAVRDVG